MAHYTDGFVVPVVKSKLAEYKKMANICGKVWREHGALSFCEHVADDAPYGKRTSFPRSVKLKDDEIVVFSWITYKSRAHRDRVNKAVMADPRIAAMKDWAMPFDGKRMIWGGFKSFVVK
jgi:uncharacterized protein YbaA (DUF1428 family)